jgi:WD40 repeat protein
MDACAQPSRPFLKLPGQHFELLCAAISDDNKLIASGGGYLGITIWDTDTQKCIHTLPENSCKVMCLDFSRDATKLVSCGDSYDVKSITVWALKNQQTPTVLHTLIGHTGTVRSVKFSPDGMKIASGGIDSRVKIWSVQSGKLLLTLEGHKKGVNSVAWSPDSRLVASAGSDKTVRVWDAVGGKEVMQPLNGHGEAVTYVVFSRTDAHLLVSASADQSVVIWELQEAGAAMRHKMYNLRKDLHNERFSVSLSPDDRFIISGGHKTTVRLWHVASQYSRKKMYPSSDGLNLNWDNHLCKYTVESVVWSRDGRYIMGVCDDFPKSALRLWEVGKQVCELLCLRHVYICVYIYIHMYTYC